MSSFYSRIQRLMLVRPLYRPFNFIQALFSQKQKSASGFWTFDATDESTLFTVSQVTTGLQVFLLIAGVGLVEVYIRKVQREKLIER